VECKIELRLELLARRHCQSNLNVEYDLGYLLHDDFGTEVECASLAVGMPTGFLILNGQLEINFRGAK
jgi:hypothetical protein